jgi:limonene-1,2-epoxide hydrolase
VEHGQVVERFFERMQARDWRAAARMLADDVHIDYTATSERFDGPAFIAMNEAYPDGWDLQVVETITQGNRVAAQVVVRHGTDDFWCAGFYTVGDGKILRGVEHWVTERSETPPEWRRSFASP